MKKLSVIVVAMILVLSISSGAPPVIAQDEGADEPTSCDLMEAAKKKACKDVREAVDMLEDGEISQADFDRLSKRCKNFADTYREECEAS